MKKIVYTQNKTTNIITPTREALEHSNIEQLAKSLVPAEVEYVILDDTQAEFVNLTTPKIDEKAKQLAEIEAEIAECENHIKHALIIGNNSVLENLRAELKELITQREKLRK